MQGATDETVSAIQAISGTITKIHEIATTIASAVEEQGAATQEIARNVQQAAAGTKNVSSNIAPVNAATEGTARASTDVQAVVGSCASAPTRCAARSRPLEDFRSAPGGWRGYFLK